MFSFDKIYCHSMEYFHSVKIFSFDKNIFAFDKNKFSFDKKRMSRDSRRHGHQAFMAWSQSSLSINMATRRKRFLVGRVFLGSC